MHLLQQCAWRPAQRVLGQPWEREIKHRKWRVQAIYLWRFTFAVGCSFSLLAKNHLWLPFLSKPGVKATRLKYQASYGDFQRVFTSPLAEIRPKRDRELLSCFHNIKFLAEYQKLPESPCNLKSSQNPFVEVKSPNCPISREGKNIRISPPGN